MPVIYMDRASAESLTEKDIREIIDENLMDLKYGMLTDYYVGQHRILSETKKDSTSRIRQPVILLGSRLSITPRMMLICRRCRIFLIITMSRIITWSWLNNAASVGAALKCYILMRTRRSVLQRWRRLI
mgnify:CR=1 FL=1